jgi:hypothetical protein
VLFLAFIVGCGSAQRAEDFVPPEDAARAALDASLKQWAAGDTGQTIPGLTPGVMISDGLRTPGRTLAKYAILGPVPADAPRCFAVNLTLGNPAAELRERYVVVGRDPVWVIRYDDYEMLTHWHHPMTTDNKSPAKR